MKPQSSTTLRLRDEEPFCSWGWEKYFPAAILLWTFLLGCTPMANFDIWWHLRTGEWIVENGWVPVTDLYTYTDPNQPWIDLHWGFQLLTLGLFSLGGVSLLVLAKASCLAMTIAIGWRATGNTLPHWAKTLCWILPVICISGRSMVRPEMLSLIFLATWLWIAENATRRPRLIWLLPVLQILWVNCHGLFVLGLVVGFAYAADRIAREFRGGRFGLEPAPESPEFLYLFPVGVLAVIACLLNPYFEEGALFPLELYRKFSVDQEFYSGIAEFQTLLTFAQQEGSFTNLYFVAELGLWLVTAVSFILLFRQRRINVMRLLLFAAFSYLAWKASRNTNIFSLVSGVVLCGNLSDYLTLRQSQQKKESRDVSSNQSLFSKRMAILTGAIVTGLIASHLTGYWAVLGQENKTFGLGEREAWYPHDAVKFAGQPGFPQRAFLSHFGLAAVYEYHLGPNHRVFMDGRLEVVSRETYGLYQKIMQRMSDRNPNWQSLLTRDATGRFPAVILDSRQSRFAIQGVYSTPGWRLVFADASAAVFIEESLAETLNLPPADPVPLKYPDGR
ncbi:MAG: hypothetical protein IID46_02095 [Planctomycetes bacterium]|nr:hypothetical protein [Planctomycetota bacterium]